MGNRPKRRKSKDNPYTLNYCEERNVYTVSFKDGKGILQNIEVSEEIYKTFDKFELDDIKELNEYDRHIEHSEIYENNLNNRAMDKPLSVDDEVVRKILTEELKKAIQELPETQKRRLEKYYFRNMTFEEIAQEENCTKMAVKFSVDIAIEKISKKLKF